jgi:predicted enzyme related to lactoylglutathione lyase
MHRSRVCHFVIDVDDLDQAVRFWSAALDATQEHVAPGSQHVYRKLRLPDSEIRILLQKTDDPKAAKERMHLDLETGDVEAEVQRLEALGASRWDHQKERGFDFWVMRDPWANEFCVLQPEFPELLAQRNPWPELHMTGRPGGLDRAVVDRAVVPTLCHDVVRQQIREHVHQQMRDRSRCLPVT